MAVSSMIAVGTSHGLVLVFDSAQTLRWCHEGNEEQGSVSALDFNHNCSRLLIGYARGLILMCDVADGKVLRTMNQVHTPATAVLHVKVWKISIVYRFIEFYLEKRGFEKKIYFLGAPVKTSEEKWLLKYCLWWSVFLFWHFLRVISQEFNLTSNVSAVIKWKFPSHKLLTWKKKILVCYEGSHSALKGYLCERPLTQRFGTNPIPAFHIQYSRYWSGDFHRGHCYCFLVWSFFSNCSPQICSYLFWNQFTDNPNLAVCSDSGGSVFELSFKRTLGIRSVDSRCIFSGSRGEVCCIEPLRLKALTTHPLHGSILVAMATLSKVHIFLPVYCLFCWEFCLPKDH